MGGVVTVPSTLVKQVITVQLTSYIPCAKVHVCFITSHKNPNTLLFNKIKQSIKISYALFIISVDAFVGIKEHPEWTGSL